VCVERASERTSVGAYLDFDALAGLLIEDREEVREDLLLEEEPSQRCDDINQ